VIKKSKKMHPSLSKGICKSKAFEKCNHHAKFSNKSERNTIVVSSKSERYSLQSYSQRKVRDIAFKATLLMKQARNSLSSVLFLMVRLPRGEMLM
jgi:hypothetical protein